MKAETDKTTDLSSFKDGLSARLKKLEESYTNRSEAVKAYGLQKGAYERWVYARSSPSVEALAKIAKVAGVSLDWLAFGEGQGPGGSKAASAAKRETDSTLMSEIYLKIHSLVQRHGYTLSPEQHIEFTCNVYNKVMSKPDDREELIADAMVLLVTMLKGLKPQEAAPETVEDKLHA